MFLDTSGLLCLFDQDDARHTEAIAFFDSDFERVTHSYVLAEFVPLCPSRGLDTADAVAFEVDLLDHPRVEVVWVEQFLHRAALTLLRSRLDKTYSLCDAVSFLIMRQRGIGDALTTDKHFTQEGFHRLLKP